MNLIKIRRGLNGFPYSFCSEAGTFIGNAETIEQIKKIYEYELKHKMLKLVKELNLYPEGEEPRYKTYGYARVSTRKQEEGNSLEAQELALREAGAEIIVREAYTGSKTDRPEFTALMEKLKGGDTLIVTKLDRFARTINDANKLIDSLLERRVKIHVLNIGIIDNSPASKCIRSIFLAFAEFERDMIVERTQEGRAMARLNPEYKEGRKKKYSDKRIQSALELLETHSYKQVEEMTGISKSTLIRAKKELV